MATTELLPNGNIRVRVDYVFSKRGGRKRLLVNGEDSGLLAENQDTAVLSSIARARRWQSYIDNGRFSNIQDLAYALKLDRSYVARTIRLSYLSPKIVRLFLQGKEPSGLTLTKLIGRIPNNWAEQEAIFGVTI